MIDGGLRAARPTGRQVSYREEPARQYPEEYQRAEAPASPERAKRRQEVQDEPAPRAVKAPRDLSWVKWLLISMALIAIAATAWFFLPKQQGVASTIETGQYQAVFLSNGQVYFGRLSEVNSEYMQLTSVFYLERQLTNDGTTEIESENEQATVEPTADNNFQLLKYSDVLYGSEDAMVISKDDIIRFENLRPDGVVAKAIASRS